MPFDASIISTTPVSALPMLPELQNLVFEFMYGSTTLYAQKRIAPICKELILSVSSYRAVIDKTQELSAMLTQYQSQGSVQSFSVRTNGHIFRDSNMTIFTINWTNRSSGPFEVEVRPYPITGSIYVTDLMLPAEEECDDEYDEYSFQYGITLELFSRNFRIQSLM